MTWIDKEIGFLTQHKMDAVALTGVWLNSPVVSTANSTVAAGIYREMLEQEKLRKPEKETPESPHERRLSLLKLVENKIMERQEDDLFLLLVA